MHLKIEIGLDNAAFDNHNLTNELARILVEYAAKVQMNGYLDHTFLDVNGNCVGKARLAQGNPD